MSKEEEIEAAKEHVLKSYINSASDYEPPKFPKQGDGEWMVIQTEVPDEESFGKMIDTLGNRMSLYLTKMVKESGGPHGVYSIFFHVRRDGDYDNSPQADLRRAAMRENQERKIRVAQAELEAIKKESH